MLNVRPNAWIASIVCEKLETQWSRGENEPAVQYLFVPDDWAALALELRSQVCAGGGSNFSNRQLLLKFLELMSLTPTPDLFLSLLLVARGRGADQREATRNQSTKKRKSVIAPRRAFELSYEEL